MDIASLLRTIGLGQAPIDEAKLPAASVIENAERLDIAMHDSVPMGTLPGAHP